MIREHIETSDHHAVGQPLATHVSETLTLGDKLYAAPGLYGRHGALLVAWVAISGSLYMSQVLGWIPCLLCWYQRILMYPLGVILLVGILRRDRGLHWYVLPLAVVGALTSLYHYLLIMTNWFPPPPCNSGVPCTIDYINIPGALSFLKVPFLALVAFLLITVFVAAWMLYQREGAATDEDDEILAATPTRALGGFGIAAIVIVATVVTSFYLVGRLN